MLINIASTSAIYAILSLNNLALYISYLQIVTSFFIAKLRGKLTNWSPFTLGRFGYAINAFAIMFLLFIIVWLPFPPFVPMTAEDMNYAGPIFGVVFCAGVGDWFVWGHKRFSVPSDRSFFDKK